jgi:hypothetical protein
VGNGKDILGIFGGRYEYLWILLGSGDLLNAVLDGGTRWGYKEVIMIKKIILN